MDEAYHFTRQLPLTEEELRRIRGLLRDDDRATWLRKQLKIFVPAIIAVVSAVYAAVSWVVSHWKA